MNAIDEAAHIERLTWQWGLEPWALTKRQEWHRAKLALATKANVDPSGDALAALQHGETWQAIADQCGMTSQAAYDRWGRYSAAGAGMDA